MSVVLRETTLNISGSFETGSHIESEIVGLVSLYTTEITEITRSWGTDTLIDHLTLYQTIPMFNDPLLKAFENIVEKG